MSSFKAVAIAWLRLYAGEEDTYEVTLRVIQNHILLNTDEVCVETGVRWFKEMSVPETFAQCT